MFSLVDLGWFNATVNVIRIRNQLYKETSNVYEHEC